MADRGPTARKLGRIRQAQAHTDRRQLRTVLAEAIARRPRITPAPMLLHRSITPLRPSRTIPTEVVFLITQVVGLETAVEAATLIRQAATMEVTAAKFGS